MNTSLKGTYRIGYLRAVDEKNTSETFLSLRLAARQLGCELIEVTNSDEILQSQLDFVLATCINQPKTTEIPTFGVIHQPRISFWEQESDYKNLLTYDGYLTISETLHQFLMTFCSGLGRPPHIGKFYTTKIKQSLVCDLESIGEQNQLKLGYLCEEKDIYLHPFIGIFEKQDYFQSIKAPYKSRQIQFPHDKEESYCTFEHFYAALGVGLVTLPANYALDNIVSETLFHIISVGAAAICPDIPWIRQNFGDNVFYYNPFESTENIISQIDERFKEIVADIQKTILRARHAKLIYEQSFAAEVMLKNVILYFTEWQNKAGKIAHPSTSPLIDVIIRIGGRPLSFILRALHSIENQQCGRFRILFVRYKDIDLSSIKKASWRRIERFEIIDKPGGNRSATLAAGLKQITSKFFALLDDDDFWLPNHIADLLTKIKQCLPERGFSYSGYLIVQEKNANDSEKTIERRHIASLECPYGDINNIFQAFSPNCWLASSALLQHFDLENWSLHTAEDTLLLGSLLCHAEPVFSYRASACSVRGSINASNWNHAETRSEDVFECFLGLQTSMDRIEHKFIKPSMSNWSRLGLAIEEVIAQKTRRLTGKPEKLAFTNGIKINSIYDRTDLELKSIILEPERIHLTGSSRFVEQEKERILAIWPPPSPWAYGAEIKIGLSDLLCNEQWLVLEFEASEQSFGVGLLNHSKNGFIARIEVLPCKKPFEIWMSISTRESVSSIVIQNWNQGIFSYILLRKIWVVKEI